MIEAPNQPKPDWQEGYGFQFWMARHGYRGDGAYGQFCVVLPEQDAVIATTAGAENMQGVLDAIWSDLLPAMKATSTEPSPLAEQLAARLASLQLPAFEAKRAPQSSPSAWADASFRPAGGRCAAQPTLSGVRLHQGNERWQLVLVEGAAEYTAEIGTRDWRTNLTETDYGRTGVPLAVSGGWTDEHTFGAEIIFLETPHRLQLSCSLSAKEFQVRWRTVPLWPARFSELRMPR